MKYWTTINGYKLFVERRRYSNRTFTWVSVEISTEASTGLRSLGDPWPCVIPARSEVMESLNRVLGKKGEVTL